jgi:hypothetical protein
MKPRRTTDGALHDKRSFASVRRKTGWSVQAARLAVARRKMAVAHTSAGSRAERHGASGRERVADSGGSQHGGTGTVRVTAPWWAIMGDPTRPEGSNSHSQLNPVVRRVNQILLRAEVPLRGLDRCMA